MLKQCVSKPHKPPFLLNQLPKPRITLVGVVTQLWFQSLPIDGVLCMQNNQSQRVESEKEEKWMGGNKWTGNSSLALNALE
jgi:hypothetical protein